MSNWIVAACNKMSGTERFIRTMERALEPILFWRPLICMYRPYFEVPAGWAVIYTGQDWPGHNKKYWPLRPFAERHLKNWFCIVDTDDVVFQRPLDIDFENGVPRMCSEGLTYAEAEFWQPYLVGKFAGIKDFPVLNAGAYAMTGAMWSEYLDFMDEVAEGFDGPVDQLGLAAFFIERQYPFCVDDRFACLYNSEVSGELFYLPKENLYAWRGGGVPCIVHGNGSMSTVLDQRFPK